MSTGNANTNYSSSTSTKFADIYGDEFALADEGSYFIATNTPGTAIATTTSVVDDATGATTHAQQKPVMLLKNQASTSNINSPNIYLRYLKMFIVQVPTSASIWRYVWRLDNLATKLTTAGTVITPVNVNPNYSNATNLYMTFGTVTTTDSSSNSTQGQRVVGNGVVTGAIPVAQDEWCFTFGAPGKSLDSIGTQTLVKRLTVPCAPIVIPPGWNLTLEMFGASNAAAPSWEFELGYVERPTGQ